MDTQNNQNNTPTTPSVDKSHKTFFGILAYLGLLVIVSFIVKKDDPFVKFHIKQGFVLLAIEVIMWFLGSMTMFWSMWSLYRIIHLALFILAIIGIVNVVQGKETELPLVGGFSKYFKF